MRTAVRGIVRCRNSRGSAAYQRTGNSFRRPFSANTAAKPEQPEVRTKERVHGKVPTPEAGAEATNTAAGPAAVETSPASSASKVPSEKAPAATVEKSSAAMPDVSSTSLGLEDPMTNDPLKWRKFAYKYAGAVLLFFVSYKTLHWYVDRLEADGKRKREELEENKTIIQGMNGPSNPQPNYTVPNTGVNPAILANQKPASFGGSDAPVGVAGNAPQAGSESMPAIRIFDPVKQEEPHLVSELEELWVYKIELEGKLKDLGSQPRTKETDAERLDIEADLKETVAEIAVLEAKSKPQ